ncbi:Tfp pilus assembly protein FimT/FimU [Thermodesulfobacteriota bacterium]
MLITGNWNNLRNMQERFKDTTGYNLIELTIVILLAGFLLSLTIPRFRNVILTDNLKSVSRKMVGTIMGLRNDAIREHKDYDLRFDLESNRFWIDSPFMTEEERVIAREKAFTLPEGIRIIDIWFKGKGKITSGETGIRISKKGYVRPSVIHLGSEDGRKFTFVLSPFISKIKILENYLDFEDI